MHISRVNLESRLIYHLNASAHLLQNMSHQSDVVYVGNILDAADAVGQNNSRNYSNSGIFGATDFNFAI